MTYDEVATLSAIALCAGIAFGIGWGGVVAFIRGLLS